MYCCNFTLLSSVFNVKKQRPTRNLEKYYQCSVNIEISVDLKVYFSLITCKINNLIALRLTNQVIEIFAPWWLPMECISNVKWNLKHLTIILENNGIIIKNSYWFRNKNWIEATIIILYNSFLKKNLNLWLDDNSKTYYFWNDYQLIRGFFQTSYDVHPCKKWREDMLFITFRTVNIGVLLTITINDRKIQISYYQTFVMQNLKSC